MPNEPRNMSRCADERSPSVETRELGENTGWAMWNEAVEMTDAQLFAPGSPPALAGGDLPFSRTEPAALTGEETHAPPPQPARRPSVTLDEVMLEAHRNNRVCPKLRCWAGLFAMFPRWALPGASLPPPPMPVDMWHHTSAIAKRMSFRAHVEWAEANRCLPELLDFLKGLPEEQWHHTAIR